MTKFIFKSNASDLQKISQSIETLQKNVLYITYRVDKILKDLNTLTVDKGLQHQVDEYFEQDPFGSAFAESLKETSPQTERPGNKSDLD